MGVDGVYWIHPFSRDKVVISAMFKVGFIINWVERGVRNHIDVISGWSLGLGEEGFVGVVKINRLPSSMIIIGMNFSTVEITGWGVGWIKVQFISLPVIILANVSDAVGIDRFIFDVLIELILNGGRGPVQTIIINRRV